MQPSFIFKDLVEEKKKENKKIVKQNKRLSSPIKQEKTQIKREVKDNNKNEDEVSIGQLAMLFAKSKREICALQEQNKNLVSLCNNLQKILMRQENDLKEYQLIQAKQQDQLNQVKQVANQQKETQSQAKQQNFHQSQEDAQKMDVEEELPKYNENQSQSKPHTENNQIQNNQEENKQSKCTRKRCYHCGST